MMTPRIIVAAALAACLASCAVRSAAAPQVPQVDPVSVSSLEAAAPELALSPSEQWSIEAMRQLLTCGRANDAVRPAARAYLAALDASLACNAATPARTCEDELGSYLSAEDRLVAVLRAYVPCGARR